MITCIDGSDGEENASRLRLSAEERAQLEAIVRKGKASAHGQRHARILLLADTIGPEGGWSDSRIAEAAHTSMPTVERVRRIGVEHGLGWALEPKEPEREYLRRLDGKAEAQLIAQSCGPAPEGRARWTLRLLAARLVELEIVDGISHETVRRPLKRRAQAVAEKAVGDRTQRQRRICRGDGGRARSLCAPGRPAREDYEYERSGVAAIFCAFAPHLGWRCIEERERKTRCDYAAFLRTLAEEHFPDAERIVLVQDNLNTHSPASLYEAFPPAHLDASGRIRTHPGALRIPLHAQARELAEHRGDRTQPRWRAAAWPGASRTAPRSPGSCAHGMRGRNATPAMPPPCAEASVMTKLRHPDRSDNWTHSIG